VAVLVQVQAQVTRRMLRSQYLLNSNSETLRNRRPLPYIHRHRHMPPVLEALVQVLL
jgi:hypothetical protein